MLSYYKYLLHTLIMVTITASGTCIKVKMADHLELGEVAFPPQVLLDFGPNAGQEVVGVHHHVHDVVEDDGRRALLC